MLTVALTGGIGSGKSAVTQLFRELGGAVVDADEISRALTAHDQPAVKVIAQKLGKEFVDAAGNLQRAALRRAVFADKTKRAMLEKILHPKIRQQMDSEVASLRKKNTPYCILAIPLLLQSAPEKRADIILVVDAPEEKRVQRVCNRDDVTAAEVQSIIATQTPRKKLLAAADAVIRNDGDRAHLRLQVENLHRQWC